MLKNILRIVFVILVLINLYFASWYAAHQDILFTSDIARDFFLLQEATQKKFVLLGPRSSAMGLFHGPLWTYINLPPYILSSGNPVAQGWYWVFMLASVLVVYYIIAKKLFGELTASLFVLMVSNYCIYHVNGLFNPHGAFFLLPIFFFTFVRYIQTKKIWFLIATVLLVGFIFQFQMAIGAPFLILTAIYILWFDIKNKKKKHLLAFLLLIIPLSTFILFDLRHDFLLTRYAFRQLQQVQEKQNIFTFIVDRFQAMSSIEFLRYGIHGGSFVVTIIFFAMLIYQMIESKYKQIYRIFAYFFFGFYILSLLNKFNLLYFYIFPLFLLVFLIFCSFVTSKFKRLFLILFAVVYITNFQGILFYIQVSNDNIIGKRVDSWKTMYTTAKKVFEQPDNDFGYLVYSPDVMGYQSRYAMEYARSQYPNKNVAIFEKKPVTYLLIEPAPAGYPYKDTFWTKNMAKITSKPTKTITVDTGYKIERYKLSENEIKTPMSNEINPELKYR